MSGLPFPADDDWENDDPMKSLLENEELDISEDAECSWCSGPLPEGVYGFCSETCRIASLADAIGDGS